MKKHFKSEGYNLSFLKIFRSIFPKKKLIYTAFGNEEYFRIVGRLKSFGVKYSTKTNIDFTRSRNITTSRFTQYDIYVREEDEHKAIEAIHKKQ